MPMRKPCPLEADATLAEMAMAAEMCFIFLKRLAGWWFGTMEFCDFHSVGNVIILTDELIFFNGVAQAPTSWGKP